MFTDKSKQRTDAKKLDVNIKNVDSFLLSRNNDVFFFFFFFFFSEFCFYYPNLRCTFFTGNSTDNRCGHIFMIFNCHFRHLSDMSEKKSIPASCDNLTDIIKVIYLLLAGLHC